MAHLASNGEQLHALPAPTHLWVTSHGIEASGGAACAKGYCNTLLCLSSHTAMCLSADDIEHAIEAVGSLVTTAYVIYQWITNRQGKNTEKSKGDNDSTTNDGGSGDDGGAGTGGDQSAGLCVASWPHSDDSNDQVYYTSNCFGNPAASWVCQEGANKYDCHWYNVEALDIHRHFELTVRNLRNGVYAYTKPPTTGDWQQWTIFG